MGISSSDYMHSISEGLNYAILYCYGRHEKNHRFTRPKTTQKIQIKNGN